ncbi:MAG: type IV toxin-antitoxin system AbiEi family antitoxin domain-containing protein [Candidatus Bathyarchaeia archaeon]
MSHLEQKIYLILESEGKSVFTVEELKKLNLPIKYGHLRVLLHRMEKKGWLTSVRKGVYLRLPAVAAVEGKAYLEDPFLVALKVFDGYLAFQSALKVHGLSEYQTFTVFVATRNKSDSLKFLKWYEIKAIKLGKRYVGYIKKNNYKVSSAAKTFFDCFYHPQYAGGYSEVLKSLHACREMDWGEFLSYFKKFASNSLCQKVGYLLTLLKETDYKVPNGVIKYLKERVCVKTRLDPNMPGGKLDKDWLVVDNFGKKELLSWWLHG